MTLDFQKDGYEKSFEEELRYYENLKTRNVEEDLQFALILSNDNKVEIAKSTYRSILEKSPVNEMANHRMAILATDDGNLAEAKKYFEKNIQTNSQNQVNYYNYALLFLVEDLDHAGSMMTKALEFSDEEHKQFYKNWINIIESIKKDELRGYQNLMKNDDFYLPNVIKLQIEDKLSGEKI